MKWLIYNLQHSIIISGMLHREFVEHELMLSLTLHAQNISKQIHSYFLIIVNIYFKCSSYHTSVFNPQAKKKSFYYISSKLESCKIRTLQRFPLNLCSKLNFSLSFYQNLCSMLHVHVYRNKCLVISFSLYFISFAHLSVILIRRTHKFALIKYMAFE